jgi:hypothetical protein
MALGSMRTFKRPMRNIQTLFSLQMGNNMNDEVELTTMVKGMQLGYNNLIIEGESQPLISSLVRIIHGVNPDKVSSNWKLSLVFSQITKIAKKIPVVIPSHVSNKSMPWHTNWLPIQLGS